MILPLNWERGGGGGCESTCQILSVCRSASTTARNVRCKVMNLLTILITHNLTCGCPCISSQKHTILKKFQLLRLSSHWIISQGRSNYFVVATRFACKWSGADDQTIFFFLLRPYSACQKAWSQRKLGGHRTKFSLCFCFFFADNLCCYSLWISKREER
jgi:hypothetical protein